MKTHSFIPGFTLLEGPLMTDKETIHTLTRTEWNALHTDYKGVREDGQKTMLWLDPKTGGTTIVPVTVPEEPRRRAYR
jgi:hypothetical protein